MATTLVAGDIAFTAFQSDNTNTALGGAGGDMFEFILLKDVEKGTTIYFTDCGFRVDPNNPQYVSKFNNTEGLIRWEAQSELKANTKISLATSGTTPPPTTFEWTGINTTNGNVITSINLALGTQGDSVTAIVSTNADGKLTFANDGFSGTAIASIYWGGDH
jgi:hypothetical protein